MKGTLIFVLFYYLLTQVEQNVCGQTKNTLHDVLSKTINKADSLFIAAENYYEIGDTEKALLLFENNLLIYQKYDKQQKVGECYSYIAYIAYSKGNYSEALSFFKKVIVALTRAKDEKGIANALNNIGAVYYSLGNYPKALDFYKQAVVIQEKIGAEKGEAITTMNIGGIYSKMRDYDSAMNYYDKVSTIFRKLGDEVGIAKMLIEVGYISMMKNDYNKSLNEYRQALAISEKEKERNLEIEVLSNLGELFYKQSDFQKALYYFNRCLKYAEKISSLQYKSRSRISTGNIYHQLGKNQKAIEKCKIGLILAEKLGAVSVEKDACECLYNSYKSLGNNQLALLYYEKVNIFEDSLHSEETANKMMNMEFQKQQLVDSIAYVKKQSIIEQKHKEEVQRKEKQRNIIIATLCIMLVVAGGLWSSLNFVRKSREALRIEKDRSEKLLLNILPEEIAEELKQKGSVNARDFSLVSILFTDFKSFTQTAEKMTPQSLVGEINVCFKAFDLISEKYQIEKIKTIGDAYMAAGGIPHPDENSLKNIVLAGLEMQAFVTQRGIENALIQKPSFEMRLGIHAGPIVAGIVGVKKFQYDVWGDTVNTASRIESNGMVGKVNISESLYQLIKDEECFTFEYRGNITAKGKGEIKMYFVERNTSKFPPKTQGIRINDNVESTLVMS
jgi:adenylate cyclase